MMDFSRKIEAFVTVFLCTFCASVPQAHAQDLALPGDVSQDAWFAQTVANMVAVGHVAHTLSFRPDEKATRGEFIELIMRVRRSVIDPEGFTQSFDDVPPGSTLFTLVEQAARDGWLSGDGGCFGKRPCYAYLDRPINRAEAAALLSRAFQLEDDTGDVTQFDDFRDETAWYYLPVHTAFSNCVLRGDSSGGTVRPADNMVRAEMAVMVERAYRGAQYPECPADGELEYLQQNEVWYPQEDCMFRAIYDLAEDTMGNSILVADHYRNRICRFSPNGKLLGVQEMENPHGITFVEPHFIYVAHYLGHYVAKYDLSGTQHLKFGIRGDYEGVFEGPVSTTVNADGDIFVVDYNNHRVQKFDKQGNFIKMWGSEGKRRGQFRRPHAIKIGPDGLLYVVDRDNARIQMFTFEGELVRIISLPGTQPLGIFIDDDDDHTLYVAEINGNRVLKVTQEGEVLREWRGFNIPTNVILDSRDRMIVTEQSTNRISVFSEH